MKAWRGKLGNTDAWFLSTLTLVIVGTALRINHWLGQRAFWGDELALIENLQTRGYEALGGPLTHDQMAPLAFLAGQKWLGETLGYTELVMRAPALLLGVAGLALFSLVARRALDHKAATFAVLFYALSNWLVYYAAELKQYGHDTFFSVAALAIVLWHCRSRSVASWLVLGISGSVVVWLSHPVAFVLAVAGTVLIVDALARRRKGEALLVVFMSLAWLASFSLHLVATSFFGSDVVGNMREIYWADTFMPLPPKSLRDLLWYPRNLLLVLKSPVGFAATGLAAMLVIVGTLRLWRRNRTLLYLAGGPSIVALLASGLQIYPFDQRFLMFSVPGILLLLGTGTALVIERVWPMSRLVVILMLGVLMLEPAASIAKQALAHTPYQREGLPEVFAEMRKDYQPGDHVYLYPAAELGWNFYAGRYGLDQAPVTLGGRLGEADNRIEQGKRRTQGMQAYLALLDAMRCHPRVWVVFAHVHTNPFDQEQLPLLYLDQYGTRLHSIRSRHESPFKPGNHGASAYLYEFAENPGATCPGRSIEP